MLTIPNGTIMLIVCVCVWVCGCTLKSQEFVEKKVLCCNGKMVGSFRFYMLAFLIMANVLPQALKTPQSLFGTQRTSGM
jgi:hypothetical protein